MRSFLCICLLFTGIVFGQTPAAALAKAEFDFKGHTSYSATIGFDLGGHHDLGKIYYSGNKYRFDYPEDLTIFDGKTIMYYSKEFAAVDLSQPGTGPDLSLGGVYGLHHFAYRFDWVDSTGQVRKMRLQAQDPDMAVTEVIIGIGRQSGLVEAYTVTTRQGLVIDYKVIEMASNPVLDEGLFKIDMDFVQRVQNGEVAPIEHEH